MAPAADVLALVDGADGAAPLDTATPVNKADAEMLFDYERSAAD